MGRGRGARAIHIQKVPSGVTGGSVVAAKERRGAEDTLGGRQAVTALGTRLGSHSAPGNLNSLFLVSSAVWVPQALQLRGMQETEELAGFVLTAVRDTLSLMYSA